MRLNSGSVLNDWPVGMTPRSVRGADRAAEGVSEQFLREALVEFRLLAHENAFELGQRLERLAARHDAARVDRRIALGSLAALAVLAFAPGADGVEVFQGQAERVDLGVAARTERHGAVLFEQ